MLVVDAGCLLGHQADLSRPSQHVRYQEISGPGPDARRVLSLTQAV
jgi:hypothetical protein